MHLDTPGGRRVLDARALTAVQLVALLGAIVTAVLTAGLTRWQIPQLAILAALAVLSEMIATPLSSGRITVSGSFLAITLGAVILGGSAALVLGVLAIVVAWLRWHESAQSFRNNLTTYAWFPLLTALAFRGLESAAGFVPGQPFRYDTNPTYYLLVFATFMIALVLNFTMVAGYECLVGRSSVSEKVKDLKPIVSAELFSALLTIVAAAITLQFGTVGLGMFALVVVIFQYLVGELLLSQRRGEELQLLAMTDELTGLANRKAFGDRVDEEIEACQVTGGSLGVLLLDLDHFKDINDTLGHQFGDDLLADLGPRLAERVGERGLVARLGGDEFAILPARRTDDVIALGQIVEEVLWCVREPVIFDEITLEVDASVGVSRYPANGGDAQTLLRRADIAMYAAKEHGDRQRIYSPEHDHHSTSRLSMVSDFRRALGEEDEIVVQFHPIVDLAARKVHGAEALVRWQHPQLGLLQPGAFLDVVEQTGLMGGLTTKVLTKAIAECAHWHASGRELTVSVNLSVRNLHDPMLPSLVAQMLGRYGLPAAYLTLEITESMIMSDPERALATVRDLGELGVQLAVDDFGTGHSSLANLRMLPVHELKIDRSFVTPMLSEASDLVIVRSTVELGHALGLAVVAEGVENLETLKRLAEIGCDRAQGHYLSKPAAAEHFVAWISSYERPVLSVA
ncbi:MAG: putative bifunctional diguanylate cyclase/phosphodiesterase [Solirubrobacteraceae bacterium]